MIEDRILELADPQGGYVTHGQLRGLGLTQDAIKHRLARRSLIVEYFEVYAVGHRPTNPMARAHGALLACGPQCGLSNHSAGSLWRAFGSWSEPFHVSTRLDRRPNGIVTHHRPALTDQDFVIEQGLRVTTPAITTFDLAPTLTRRRLLRVVNELRIRKLLELGELRDLLTRFPRHPGAKHIRGLLKVAQKNPTRSGDEDAWPTFAASYGFTNWDTNVFVGPYRTDVLFLPDLLIVEIDGPNHELTADEDKDRDADILTRFQIPTLRIPLEDYRTQPDKQAARIHKILTARRASRPGNS